MADADLSRRLFLMGSSVLAGSSLARLSVPGLVVLSKAARSARDEGAPFRILTANEARVLAAIAARILPTTDTPGANEAGVIYFMDTALGSFIQDELESIRAGISEFESGISTPFPDLSEQEQDAYLRTRDRSRFFYRVRFMTIAGFFAMSAYGGNRDEIGWKLIGFEGNHGPWEPPFGYYDAEVMRSEQDGE
jgi:gluconate 2-dehydrogenase gamma chain